MTKDIDAGALEAACSAAFKETKLLGLHGDWEMLSPKVQAGWRVIIAAALSAAKPTPTKEAGEKTIAYDVGYAEGYESGADDLHKWMRRAEKAEAALSAAEAGEVVAWRVRDFGDGWILFHTEAEARREARDTGQLVQPLYATPPTPDARADAGLVKSYYGEPISPTGDAADVDLYAPAGLTDEGIDFALSQLCAVLGVDEGDVSWDAATETRDGDVRSVICNIMRVKYGEDWSPKAATSPTQEAGRVAAVEAVLREQDVFRNKRADTRGHFRITAEAVVAALATPDARADAEGECPRCRGSGMIDGTGEMCPRCAGEGAIQPDARADAEGAGWQPIDTAPHNVEVLLATPPFECMGESARWELRVGCASWGYRIGGYSNRGCDGHATHWQPLPAAPVARITEARQTKEKE